MNKTQQQSLLLSGFLISIAAAILFSTKAILVKLAFRDTGVAAVSLLMLRMLFSLPFYVGAIWWMGKKEKKQPLTPRQTTTIFLLGILGYYLSSLFDFIGLQYVSAGLERLILFLYPTFSVILNAVWYKVKLNRTQLFALVLTYLGIGLAYFGEIGAEKHDQPFYFGSFMIFLCAITYSIYLVGSGRMVQHAGVTRYTAYSMLSATTGIFIHFIFSNEWQSIPLDATLIGYGIAIAIIATVVPSFMISSGMKKIGSNNVSIITSIGPVSTILQAHFFLQEKILLIQLIGTSLVIVGVVLIGWQSRSAHPPLSE